MSAPKRYRIEQNLRRDADPDAGPSLSDVLAAVEDLKRLVEPGRPVVAEAPDAANFRREVAELYELRRDLDTMKDAIASTKREIASLYRSENQGKGMRRVAGELDAVVEATEAATTTILSAVEEIETAANMLRAAGVESGTDNVGLILEKVVALYESCNFQDLTGQRIGKIVGVLKFVEERLDRMIEVWGGLEAFRELAGDTAPAADPDDHRSLLNGPKLEDDEGHVGQNDIDALFG